MLSCQYSYSILLAVSSDKISTFYSLNSSKIRPYIIKCLQLCIYKVTCTYFSSDSFNELISILNLNSKFYQMWHKEWDFVRLCEAKTSQIHCSPSFWKPSWTFTSCKCHTWKLWTKRAHLFFPPRLPARWPKPVRYIQNNRTKREKWTGQKKKKN